VDQAQSPADVNPEPDRPEGADLTIGVLTAGESSSLQTVVKIVQDGMLTHLAGLSAAVIHVDATLPDEQTGQVEHIADGIRVVHTQPARTMSTDGGLVGWGEAVRTVLGASRTLQARAVVMLNAGIVSMTPEWIRGLAQPVLKEGCTFVLPVYERGRYEGTLTQVFVVPLMRALFGHQFWHPMADEFGCSGEVAQFLLAQDIWSTDIARQGLEFWLPVALADAALPVTQSVLGPRILAPAGQQPPLGSTVGRVAGALFSIAERHEAGWLDVRGSEPVTLFGAPPGPATRVAAIDPERMLEGFRQGVRDLLPIWERILSPESLGDVLVLSEYPTGEFRLADHLWARIVFDFLLAYRARVMYRSHIAQSLAPLYLGCAASLVLETRSHPEPAVAQAAERLACAFESEKQYLVDRWR
jgi:glucosylglycerate synthase